MASCSPSDLLAAGKCFECLTEKQLDIAIAQLLRQWLGGSPSVESLLASGACFSCLTTKELEIAKAQLLCNMTSGSGGGGDVSGDFRITDLSDERITGFGDERVID